MFSYGLLAFGIGPDFVRKVIGLGRTVTDKVGFAAELKKVDLLWSKYGRKGGHYGAQLVDRQFIYFCGLAANGLALFPRCGSLAKSTEWTKRERTAERPGEAQESEDESRVVMPPHPTRIR